jgi:hypothetical protein
MQELEVEYERLKWPSMCCRCGSRDFKFRRHSENVVVWTLIGVTKYQSIGFDIPVCDSCAGGAVRWFAGAVVAGLLGWACLELGKNNSSGALFFFVIAIVCAVVGTTRKPMRILKLKEDEGLLRLGVYDSKFAAALRRQRGRDAGTVNSPSGAKI